MYLLHFNAFSTEENHDKLYIGPGLVPSREPEPLEFHGNSANDVVIVSANIFLLFRSGGASNTGTGFEIVVSHIGKYK